MFKTVLKRSNLILCLTLLIAPLINTASVLPEQSMAGSDGKQIIFMVDGDNVKLTDVIISGTNQNHKLTTWEKHDPKGFKLAYTKNWWWSEDFVQIDFSFQDSKLQTSISGTCLIDVLEQPIDSPRVEIIYFQGEGCVGGETGNSRNPIAKPIQQKAQKIQAAFKTLEYYLSDFKFDVFIDTFTNTAIDNLGCLVGIGASLETFGIAGLAVIGETDLASSCASSINDIKEVLSPEN